MLNINVSSKRFIDQDLFSSRLYVVFQCFLHVNNLKYIIKHLHHINMNLYFTGNVYFFISLHEIYEFLNILDIICLCMKQVNSNLIPLHYPSCGCVFVLQLY